jgi:NAD-dependent deacetylase
MPTLDLPAALHAKLRAGAPILALTGAGVSAESGLATFRGPGGLWRGRDPVALATPEAFRREPETVWRFYAWRREQAAAARPNAAHRALVELERNHPDFLLVTQNVDGLHERCGSRRVVRLHGSLWRVRCVAEGTECEDARVELGAASLPRCGCGALLRPAVVWFGEPLPEHAWREAARAARRAALVIVAGTSSLVQPAASLPRIARAAGAYVVELNPERTPLSAEADARLAEPAGVALPALAQLLPPPNAPA